VTGDRISVEEIFNGIDSTWDEATIPSKIKSEIYPKLYPYTVDALWFE